MSYKARRDDAETRADAYLPCRVCGTATPTETLSAYGAQCVTCAEVHARQSLPECHAPQHAPGTSQAVIARDNLLAIQRVRRLTQAQREFLTAVERQIEQKRQPE